MERNDIQALKHADAVTFHHLYDGSSEIRAHAQLHGDVWSARDQRLFPETSSHDERMRAIKVESRIRRYEGASSSPTAFHMIHSARVPMFQTIVSTLREGDKLTLKWVASNNNQNVRDIGWQRDELYLVVTREGKKTREMTYLITVEVGPDNTARMVKP